MVRRFCNTTTTISARLIRCRSWIKSRCRAVLVARWKIGAGSLTSSLRFCLIPKSSSVETKQHIYEVLAHETAHHWFGDLVTMAWWDNLWLNEVRFMDGQEMHCTF